MNDLVTIDHYTDRSRTLRYERCPRARWWEYEYRPTPQSVGGIVGKRVSMHLAVGAAFHSGAAELLMGANENDAVEIALAEFDTETAVGLDPGYNEIPEVVIAAQVTSGGGTDGLSQSSAGQSPFDGPVQDSTFEFADGRLNAEQIATLSQPTVSGAEVFEQFLRAEQRALVEALVRGWARRRLRPLLEQYEVLEVEQEGKWILGEWGSLHLCACGHDHMFDVNFEFYHRPNCVCGCTKFRNTTRRLWWMSRHDGLLLDRATGQLVIQSFKTTGALDGRKLRDAQRDMQGLSEAVEAERRLGKWWRAIRNFQGDPLGPIDKARNAGQLQVLPEGISEPIFRYLYKLPAPPRIDAIRYEYVLKGERWEDKELSSRCGFKAKTNRTPLLQAWAPTSGNSLADGELKHSFKWVNELGENKSLYYKNWHKQQVYEGRSIADWLDMLDSGQVQPEARQPGDLSQPQDVLGDQFPPSVLVYRQDDDLRDWLEQTEAQERKVIEDAQAVRAVKDEAEARSLLNQRFPQNRQSCSYPGECEYASICYGGADIRRDPLGGGRYREREPNHPQEHGV